MNIPEDDKYYIDARITFPETGKTIVLTCDEFFDFGNAVWFADTSWNDAPSHHPTHVFKGRWQVPGIFLCDNGDRIALRISPHRRRGERQHDKLHRIAQRDYERLLIENTSKG